MTEPAEFSFHPTERGIYAVWKGTRLLGAIGYLLTGDWLAAPRGQGWGNRLYATRAEAVAALDET